MNKKLKASSDFLVAKASCVVIYNSIHQQQNNKTYYGFNNDLYEINIVNINPITDAGDTKGGFSIYIKTLASFRLRFNYRDTIGSIIGFRYVGDPNSVTKYSGIENNFIRFNLTIYINC